MNRICPSRSIARSPACGSLTLTIISARSKTSAAPPAIAAPTAAYSASPAPMPSPAPRSTMTSWPCRTTSFTLSGVRPTRYSWFLISLGTPMSMEAASLLCEMYGGSPAPGVRPRALPPSSGSITPGAHDPGAGTAGRRGVTRLTPVWFDDGVV